MNSRQKETIVKFSQRYTRSRTLSKDIVQESFVKLWENRRNIDPKQPLMAYLFQIVRNASLKYIRSQEPANITLDDLPGYVLQSDDYDPADSAPKNERGKRMLGWIDQLPSRQREAIRLSRFEEFDHEEIASIMGI